MQQGPESAFGTECNESEVALVLNIPERIIGCCRKRFKFLNNVRGDGKDYREERMLDSYTLQSFPTQCGFRSLFEVGS